MAIRIDKPQGPPQYAPLQAPTPQRPKSFLESAPGQQLVGKASGAALNKAGAGLGKAATLGANSLAQGSFAPGLGAALGGSTTGATLGSTLAGAGGTLGSALGGAGTALGTAGLGAAATAAAPFVLGGAALGKAFGLFNRGTPDVPMMDYGADPLGLEKGTPMVHGYQDGVDSVPAFLTPGEAVIPAEAAQDPMNKPMINNMIQQGRAEQDAAQPMSMQGPLSGKAKREEMKVLQDMSLKKKSWLAEEERKQDAHNQKMEMAWMKTKQSMQQSQE